MSKRKLTESEKKIIACSQKWTCQKCNELLPSSYQVDHIVPHCITADDSQNNLVALCPTCHADKTQKENKRIIQYKKLRAEKNVDICWFCLESGNHICNKILKNIIPDNPLPIKSFERYYYTDRLSNDIHLDMSRMNIDTTLRIKLCKKSGFIYINNFFTTSETFNIDEIAEAVFISTRTKKESRKYTEVEITISLGDNTPDELVEYINNNLPQKLPQRIFNPHSNIDYIYIID